MFCKNAWISSSFLQWFPEHFSIWSSSRSRSTYSVFPINRTFSRLFMQLALKYFILSNAITPTPSNSPSYFFNYCSVHGSYSIVSNTSIKLYVLSSEFIPCYTRVILIYSLASSGETKDQPVILLSTNQNTKSKPTSLALYTWSDGNAFFCIVVTCFVSCLFAIIINLVLPYNRRTMRISILQITPGHVLILF